MEKIIVSIIDDNKVIRDNISKFIGLHDEFTVGGVYHSALSFLDSQAIQWQGQMHLLLLDIGLPSLSGIEAIPLILKREPNINIVIFTIYEEEEIILKALCAGACAYISKRGTMHEIIKALRIVADGGSYMSPSIAREIVNHLMGGHISKASTLSARQKEILHKLIDGKSYNDIATELFISVETVRSHIKKMYRILRVNNKTEAIRQYMRGHIK